MTRYLNMTLLATAFIWVPSNSEAATLFSSFDPLELCEMPYSTQSSMKNHIPFWENVSGSPKTIFCGLPTFYAGIHPWNLASAEIVLRSNSAGAKAKARLCYDDRAFDEYLCGDWEETTSSFSFQTLSLSPPSSGGPWTVHDIATIEVVLPPN